MQTLFLSSAGRSFGSSIGAFCGQKLRRDRPGRNGSSIHDAPERDVQTGGSSTQLDRYHHFGRQLGPHLANITLQIAGKVRAFQNDREILQETATWFIDACSYLEEDDAGLLARRDTKQGDVV
jgi:hypothetical protein